MESNPNGANQYLLDPRQKACWDFYINPKSATFGNAKQSAIKAGYSEEYSGQITVSEWFLVKIRRLNLLNKAERVLEEMVDMDDYDEVTTQSGDVIRKTNPALTKIKQDTAKFIAERVGKDEGYSTRSEVTGKDGDDINLGLVILPTKNDRTAEPENPLESAA
jgi:phage terminase small subunit